MKTLTFLVCALLLAVPVFADAPTLTLNVEINFSGLTSEQAVEKVQQIMKANLGGAMTYTIRSQSANVSSGNIIYLPENQSQWWKGTAP